MNPVLPTMFLVALLAKGLWRLRHSIMFFPHRQLTVTPASIGQQYSNIKITTTTPHYVVHGWFMQSTNPDAPLIIFSHGNAGNISHRMPFIDFWRQYLSSHYSL